MTDLHPAPAPAPAPESGSSTPDAFVAPAAMENDPDELFAGDRGLLDAEVRRVLVRLLQRRFLLADKNRGDWTVLLEHQHVVESRLNDLFLRLVVDHDRGVAYKQQLRSDELDIPILLRDEPYTRAETLVLLHLRTVYQRESTAGEASVRVDVEDVEQTVLTYFAEADGDTARRQKAIRGALGRLTKDGVVDEESEGRYRISPLVEILLSAERLRELLDWLKEQSTQPDRLGELVDVVDDPDGAEAESDADIEPAADHEPEGAVL